MKRIVSFDTAEANPENPGVLDISPEEVRGEAREVLLVDVRRNEEFVGELGHIPGARLITLDLLPDQIDELPKNVTIVFICRSGSRSGRAAGLALTKGFKHVFNMKGGMIAWNSLEFETSTEDSD
ncbi:MAG: rhodanese-like domain-containing protein [Pseudomonadota bacterium]|nr:rhodanese-like domain-containing protein [Pseudomonadota bacterium]